MPALERRVREVLDERGIRIGPEAMPGLLRNVCFAIGAWLGDGDKRSYSLSLNDLGDEVEDMVSRLHPLAQALNLTVVRMRLHNSTAQVQYLLNFSSALPWLPACFATLPLQHCLSASFASLPI